jgi:hypothetical protein
MAKEVVMTFIDIVLIILLVISLAETYRNFVEGNLSWGP